MLKKTFTTQLVLAIWHIKQLMQVEINAFDYATEKVIS